MPTEACHPDALRPPEIEDRDRRDRVVVAWIGPDERDRVTVRADPRLGVSDVPARQRARRRDLTPRAEVDREQMAKVAVALDRAADDDGRPTVEREVELLDHSDRRDVLGRHRATGHGRQPSGAGTLRTCPPAGLSAIDSLSPRRSRPRWPRVVPSWP